MMWNPVREARLLRFWFLLAALSVAALAASGCAAPPTPGGPVEVRRLSPDQYRRIIADVFGEDVDIPGRFEPGVREEGLLAVGSSLVTVTPSGYEQFNVMAQSIAGQVVDADHRRDLIPCEPADPAAADDACTRQLLEHYGRLLWRRPLLEAEIEERLAVARSAVDKLDDFYAGVEFSLVSLLVSPLFLFTHESAEPDPERPGEWRLDAYSKASRLSFLLWNTSPDDELLAAAESGEIHTEEGLAHQVERLMASPRLEQGVRAFFADMLELDLFTELTKDSEIYPEFSVFVANDAKEQTLRTIVDHLVAQEGSYLDLFTTRKTFMNRTLGYIYRVPVRTKDGWEEFEFAPEDPRGGLLTQASFLSLHAHPTRSSATLRGKALREELLCQVVPDPPANVSFLLVQDTDNPEFKTARDRLARHNLDPVCAGCHRVMDPMGLALENFDGIGQFRAAENGQPIDASGTLDGIPFDDQVALGQAMREHPATASCLVERVFAYGTGHPASRAERDWLQYMSERFARNDHSFLALLRELTRSEAFFKVKSPRQTGEEMEVAQARGLGAR